MFLSAEVVVAESVVVIKKLLQLKVKKIDVKFYYFNLLAYITCCKHDRVLEKFKCGCFINQY